MKEQLRQWLGRAKELLTPPASRLKRVLGEPKNRYLAIGLTSAFLYAAGLLAQFLNNRGRWLPGQELRMPSLNPFRCLAMMFTPYGATAILGLFLFLVMAFLFFWMNKEDHTGMVYDRERKFWYSDKGVYGTAGWMNDKELRECFDLTPVEKAGEVSEIIYGVKDGMVVSRKAGSRAKRAYNLFCKAGEKLKGNICLGLGVRLSIMQNEEIADLMCGSDMELLALGQRKMAYFLVLNDQDDSTRFVAATFFSLLFLRLVQYADREAPGRTLPVPVTLLLDEFCSIVGSLGGYPQKLSNVRSRGIQICQICQSLGQLMNRFPDYQWSEILGNMDTMICLGCSSDQVTAKFISDRSGEVTIYADTVMKQRNIYTPSALQPSYRHSEGAGRRMLLTPDEVMRLPANEMLVMVNHEQMLKLEKFDYTRNPESKKFRPVSIRGLSIVPQPASVPEEEGMAILEQVPQKNEPEPSRYAPVPQPAEQIPMRQPTGKRRRKTEKEVLSEGEQIRFDGYLFESDLTQRASSEFSTKGTPSVGTAEEAPGAVHKISKPNV
ncbi:type IV secretory system conjugative DNA transfer family protein [Anaerotruncus colihominis]|uniref:type IV secretory system conjugative DNA transfer family protein n=1 Tax=Anaerotruncus colihominis TaxID=169435 RepID=UPI002431F06B|nr:type IV secretory system conjugative DNA transfer family protein [Anaerotruncus colihominis]